MSRIVLLGFVLAALVVAQVPPASPELKQAAADSTIPAVKALYEEFAVPFDRVRLSDRKAYRVRPLGVYNRKGLEGTVALVPVEPVEKDRLEYLSKCPATEVVTHESYEKLAFDALDALKKMETVPGLERQLAAERVLAAVLRFHDSERLNGVRKGDAWPRVRDDVRKRLLNVRLEQLEARTGAGDWEQAVALGRRLITDSYVSGREAEAPAGLGAALDGLIGGLHADPKMPDDRKFALLAQVSKSLQPLEGRPGTERPVGRLQVLAKKALADANAANEATPPNLDRAQEFRTRAELLWPRLEDLPKFVLRVERPAAVLRVGVRELPEFLSPARAATDNERRLLDLLFESLMKPRRDRHGHLSYVPQLADGPPVVVPQGRRFRLDPSAVWSTGEPVRAADVRHTLTLLTTDPGRFPRRGVYDDALNWYHVLKEGSVDDVRRLEVRYQRPWLDPLAAATFKVVPAQVAGKSGPGGQDYLLSEEFARNPVGSGPFVKEAVKTEGGRQTLVFKANQLYGRRRLDQAALPALRAVHFTVTTDPVKDFELGLIDLALDVGPEQVQAWQQRREVIERTGTPELKQRLKLTVPRPTVESPSRRVYFLAINEKTPGLESKEARRALAHSVPREDLLRDHLSGGLSVHTPLATLYPVGTWAEALVPENEQLPFDREKAGALLRSSLRPGTKFQVALPANEPALRRAFEAWAKEVETQAGPGKLKLELVERPVRTLQAEVAAGRYDLAYSWYDYPDDTFWLRPLFDKIGNQDTDLDGPLNAVRDHRDFARVKEATRALARELAKEVPVIPLWQLVPLHLMHASVKPEAFDPQWPFQSSERWTVNRP